MSSCSALPDDRNAGEVPVLFEIRKIVQEKAIGNLAPMKTQLTLNRSIQCRVVIADCRCPL